MTTMRAAVLVPTYRRPDDLRRCLTGLAGSDRRPDEIIVVHRPDDRASADVVAEFPALPIRVVLIDAPGQVAAMNKGIETIDADFVALIDDDAIPHADWLQRIERWYLDNPDVGGVGGRDLVHEHGSIVPASADKVGIIPWFGRMVGNHHIGRGPARVVDVLKGANMSFRIAALGDHRFDVRLRGSGAQVHNEIGFCMLIRRAGWKLIYDPAIHVDHFPAIRHDEDARTGFSVPALLNTAHNEQLAIVEALPRRYRPFFLIWSFVIGTAQVPGPVQVPRLFARGDRHVLTRMTVAWRGRAAGLATWRRSPRPTV